MFDWGSAAGGFASGLFNYNAQQQTNSTMTRNAWEQRSWENKMSSTAHQREVKDLIAAGLNPNLSAGGNGASTPSVAPPSIQAPQIDMTPIFSAMSLKQEQEKIDIQNKVANASIAKGLTDQDLTRAKTLTSKKGLVRSEAEGEVYKLMKDLIKNRNKYFGTPSNSDTMKLWQKMPGTPINVNENDARGLP